MRFSSRIRKTDAYQMTICQKLPMEGILGLRIYQANLFHYSFVISKEATHAGTSIILPGPSMGVYHGILYGLDSINIFILFSLQILCMGIVQGIPEQ